jgi:hypothetical protein
MMKRSLFVIGVGLCVSCGGGKESQPAAPNAVGASVAADGTARKSDAAGTRATNGLLTVVNGETDQPVAGASVTVSGRPFTADASGQFTAPDPVLPDALVEITASGFLKRETLVRSDVRFSLWPDKSGFPQAYTQETIYAPGFTQESKLTRPAAAATIVFSPEVDAETQGVARDAAALLTAANGGQIVFSVGAPSAVTITIKINPGHPFFASNPNAQAVAEVPFIGNTIGASNGAINFKDAGVSHVKALVAHELGHHFGLSHPTLVPGMMNAVVDANRADYADAEKLAMRMMLKRRPGNSFPDNDRAVVAAARGRGLLLYACEAR